MHHGLPVLKDVIDHVTGHGNQKIEDENTGEECKLEVEDKQESPVGNVVLPVVLQVEEGIHHGVIRVSEIRKFLHAALVCVGAEEGDEQTHENKNEDEEKSQKG